MHGLGSEEASKISWLSCRLCRALRLGGLLHFGCVLGFGFGLTLLPAPLWCLLRLIIPLDLFEHCPSVSAWPKEFLMVLAQVLPSSHSASCCGSPVPSIFSTSTVSPFCILSTTSLSRAILIFDWRMWRVKELRSAIIWIDMEPMSRNMTI